MAATANRNIGVLVALDALAVAVGTLVAFALGAAVHYESLDLEHVAAIAFPAVFFCVLLALASFWAVGLYGTRAHHGRLLEIAGALAWVAVPLAFGALYWEWAPEAPLMVIAAGFALTTALVFVVRVLHQRRS
jgi:hypothetical protein